MPSCPTCRAHLGTIAALRDVIKAQTQSMKLLEVIQSQPRAGPAPQSDEIAAFIQTMAPAAEDVTGGHMERQWYTEEEEEVISKLADGEITDRQSEQMLAAIQAQQPPLSVVR